MSRSQKLKQIIKWILQRLIQVGLLVIVILIGGAIADGYDIPPILILVGIVALIWLIMSILYAMRITKFASYSDEAGTIVPGKTPWDWMQLLLVPVLLAVGGFFLSSTVQQGQQLQAEKQQETDREIAADNLHEVALQNYLDKMTDLLLHESLSDGNSSEAKTVARVRTLTVLRGLDGLRRGEVIQFLYESRLINGDTPTIRLEAAILIDASLELADLHGANLEKANLEKANFERADISEANLSGANLLEADLTGADITGTNFTKANLVGMKIYIATLKGSNFLGADLRGARLAEAHLDGDFTGALLSNAYLPLAHLDGAYLPLAHLDGAYLYRATLMGTHLERADIKNTNLESTMLMGAHLERADIRGAHLAWANLVGADLSGADLSGAQNVTVSQLASAKLDENTTLPSGKKYDPAMPLADQL